MRYVENKVESVKIAYIGGGSRGWAWGLMSDLVSCDKMSGDVYLYDIDFEAAKANEIIGNKFNYADGAKSAWNYKAVETIQDALQGADAVVVSIMPGTLDEMESDVHTPEKYGIYQSVGDTTGPGGIVRAMRTVPMFEYIGKQIKENCPNAWVINYTNPMTLCVKTLYRVFPDIKAFGCCHEVYGTQKLLRVVIENVLGIENVEREEIKVNPIAVNHFTWLTSASYRNIDLVPCYQEFIEKFMIEENVDKNWANRSNKSAEIVKKELFQRYGYIAAAGDRHLAEFCPGNWFLESPEKVKEKGFELTSVAYRKNEWKERYERSQRLVSGEETVEIKKTGEEGVHQLCALFGLGDLVTNVNIPNQGQIPNLPIGAIVETNAVFRANSLVPVFAGEIPKEIYPLVSRVCYAQETLSDAIAERDLEKIFSVFVNDPLVVCGVEDARKLFNEMCENTKAYLAMYK